MEDIKESVRRQFSPVAAAYAASPVHAGGPDLAALVAAAEPTGRERALDVGSGPGHTALALAPHVAAVTALDLSQEMLDQGAALAAERGLSNVQFLRGDAERLDLPDAAFDIVTSRYSAHHYPRPAAVLREIARVLRPGGRLLVRLPAYEWLRSRHDRQVHTRRRYTAGEVRRMIADAGFEVERLTYALCLLFPIPATSRLLERFTPDPGDESAMGLPPAPLNAALRLPMALEAAWLGLGGSFPFGLSIVCLARKAEAARPQDEPAPAALAAG